ncbi:MAG: hypothetical protein HY879_25980 [Deltaproteobacteria bacterium]|nr:hypothetical protein [Deltaproteobacteria bacterium]
MEIDPLACRCTHCKKIFFIVDGEYIYPNCRSNQIEIISGKKFFIKDIVVK